MQHRSLSILSIQLLSFFYCLLSASAYADHGPVLEQKQKTLVISNSKAWKPFAYMEDGQPKGVLIDFWKLYGERSGTKIVFNLIDWQPSLNEVAEGHANIHAGLVYSKERAEIFEFGSVLFNVQTSIYIDVNLMGIIDEDLNNIKQPVGVVQGGYEEGGVRENYPHLNLITYANNALLFEAIRKQEISVFVADKQVANFYMVSFSERANDFVSLVQLYDEPIRFAVTKGDFMLLRLVEAQLKMLSKGDIDQIRQKWINTETKVPVWFYHSIIFSLLFAAATYIFFLRKAVKKRTLQLAIVNDKLTLQANSDVLTGLYNRRFLMESLREIKGKNNIGDFAILMIDIDFFKSINDNYGHTAGDVVLTILAKRMLSCMRENDILTRIGGEGFCAILGKVSPENMQTISDKVNQRISESPFKHREEQFDITVSIGAIHIKNNQKWSSEQILQQVDKLLYEAKNTGRDQTICGELI